MSLSYKIQKDTNLIISLSGNLLEKEKANDLVNEINNLLSEGYLSIILSFEKLDYINSLGLNVFISLLTKVRNAGGDLVICSVPKKIEQLLLITKLNSIFTVAQNEEHAIQLLNKTLHKTQNSEL